MHRRRGLRLVVSDLLDPRPRRLGRALRRLSARHRVWSSRCSTRASSRSPTSAWSPSATRRPGPPTTWTPPRARSVDASRWRPRHERAANADAVRRAGAAHLVVSTGGDWLRDLTRLVVRERRPSRRWHRQPRGRPHPRLVAPRAGSMTFLSPDRLWLLLGVLALLAAYLLAQRRRRRHAVRFAALPLLARVAPSPGWRRHLSAVLFLAMAVLLVTGFARPEAEVRVPRERASSWSPRPERLHAGRRRQPDRFTRRPGGGERLRGPAAGPLPGRLVPFSDTASVAVPPTTDHALVHRGDRRAVDPRSHAIGDRW